MISTEEILQEKTFNVLLIQCAIRRKFAYKKYFKVRRLGLITHVLPVFQAHVRGYLQRARFRTILEGIRYHRMVIKIQTAFRMYMEVNKIREIYRVRDLNITLRSTAITIQAGWRGSRGRKRGRFLRNVLWNERLLEVKNRAKRELAACKIQGVFRQFMAECVVKDMIKERDILIARKALEDLCAREVQRVFRGMVGRTLALDRIEYFRHEEYRWRCALEVQRVVRGHKGRKLIQPVVGMLILLLMPLAGLLSCVGLDFVTPYRCNLF
jgi:hypothetical protein